MRAIIPRVRITPRTYMLHAILKADHWNYAKGISELVDNSFGVAAGDADNVTITVGQNFLNVEDDGGGVEDISKLFTLGDSDSRYSDSDIGKFGYGAKSACIWMCKHTFASTWRDGLKIEADVNWKRLMDLEPDEWPMLNTKATKISNTMPSGTRVMLHGFNHKKNIHIDALCKRLGETYAMAIRAGKTITIIDERNDSVKTTVQAYTPTGLSEIQKFSGVVDGKQYTAEVGVLADQVGSANGIRFCYGHRIIEVKTNLCGTSIPLRIFGYVMLAPEWKLNLSTNKTELIDSEDLEKDLAQKCAGIFQLASQYQRDMVIEELSAALSESLSDVLRSDPNGDRRGLRRPTKEGDRPDPEPNPSPTVLPDKDGDKPATTEQQNIKRGIRIKVDKCGIDSHIGYVTDDDTGLVVVLNEDSPLMRKAIEDQIAVGKKYSAAYIQVIGLLIAVHCAAKGARFCIRVFGDSRIGDAKDALPLANKILTWWSSDATKAFWEPQ